jgi:N-acetyl-gamma-glutamyl-phosphate reductase
MKNKIKVGVVGAAGYTGGETMRLLLNHPTAGIVFAHSRSQAGAPVYAVHTDLLGDTELQFTSELSEDVDVLFLCLGHGESKPFLNEHRFGSTKIIDLSQDFRLHDHAAYGDGTFVYGLPELNKERIAAAQYVANPGCFATALQLSLLPLAAKGLLQEVHATGITGSTGAGQKLQASTHFSRRANNIEAYKTLSHQHLYEVMETLTSLQAGARKVNFILWKGDFTRGIYVSVYIDCGLNAEQAYELYSSFYESAVFTTVSNNMINLKQVVNTNKCLLYPEVVDGKLVVHAAIDNLLKGAAGQAVQNMNLMFGLPEDEGLRLKANVF